MLINLGYLGVFNPLKGVGAFALFLSGQPIYLSGQPLQMSPSNG